MKHKAKHTSYIVIVLMVLVLFVAVVQLMQYVQNLLRSDVRISLSEIVTQNKDVILSKLSLELNDLEANAKQLSARIDQEGSADHETVRRLFLEHTAHVGEAGLCWADAQGNALFGSAEATNVAGRKYFQLAMEGSTNISDQIVSRVTGEDIFVASVPLYYRGEIIGTLQRQYPPKEMYALCSVSLFSQQGSMNIINSDGYVLISSNPGVYNEANNYYRTLYLENPEAAMLLEENIRANRSGLLELRVGGVEVFSTYTPMEGLYDWYLITSIDTGAVMSNAEIVVRLFYVILFLLVLSFAGILLYSMRLKRNQQQHLEALAFVDEVTGGDTYTRFLSTLPELLESSGAKYHILVFDIDGFHYINRFYGFETGDKILKTVYAQCSAHLRVGEQLARVSADQFVVALHGTGAQALTDFLCAGTVVEGVSVYFSAGMYPIKDKSEGLSLMVDKAALAATETKGKRFKQVGMYSAEFDAVLARNEQLKQEIDLALQENAFEPYFQPKVDIRDNRLTGAEALARWVKADGSLVSPAAFVPISEQTGVISLIDWIILEKTLVFLRKNLDAGVSCVPISVNFSRSHLLDKHFMEKLDAQLRKHRVPGKLLEVELTETTIFDNAAGINRFIEQLHTLDVTVSMDDFGSGYSSLHMLKDVNIDVLKIDQAFLRGDANAMRRQTVFEAIAQMASRLQLETVVEGVETAEHVAAMRQTACAVAQGYFYARPMCTKDFEVCYREGHV